MNDQRENLPPAFSGWAVYRITVQGRIPPSWCDRLAGMELHFEYARASGATRSVLVGPLRDQSELNGVLDVLFTLNLPIIRVEQVEDESRGGAGHC